MTTKTIEDIVAEGYSSQEALKEWEAEKDQNTLTQNIVALLGIHGMHCKFYEYQDASHITKAFKSLFTQLVKEVEAGERERIHCLEQAYEELLTIRGYLCNSYGTYQLQEDKLSEYWRDPKPEWEKQLKALTPPTSDEDKQVHGVIIGKE